MPGALKPGATLEGAMLSGVAALAAEPDGTAIGGVPIGTGVPAGTDPLGGTADQLSTEPVAGGALGYRGEVVGCCPDACPAIAHRSPATATTQGGSPAARRRQVPPLDGPFTRCRVAKCPNIRPALRCRTLVERGHGEENCANLRRMRKIQNIATLAAIWQARDAHLPEVGHGVNSEAFRALTCSLPHFLSWPRGVPR